MLGTTLNVDQEVIATRLKDEKFVKIRIAALNDSTNRAERMSRLRKMVL
jgi:hypothetical protein